jgi:hypothetical protein
MAEDLQAILLKSDEKSLRISKQEYSSCSRLEKSEKIGSGQWENCNRDLAGGGSSARRIFRILEEERNFIKCHRSW